MEKLIDSIVSLGRLIYNGSDWLLNLQPYRNQTVEIAIFTVVFILEVAGLAIALFTSILISIFMVGLLAVTLWILVTMFYALDQMDKFKALAGNEDKEIDNCATNLCVVVKCARHAEDIECKTQE